MDAGTTIMASQRDDPLAGGADISSSSNTSISAFSGSVTPSPAMTCCARRLVISAMRSMPAACVRRSNVCRAYMAPLAPVTATIIFIAYNSMILHFNPSEDIFFNAAGRAWLMLRNDLALSWNAMMSPGRISRITPLRQLRGETARL